MSSAPLRRPKRGIMARRQEPRLNPRHILLADGTQLSADFSQRVWDAQDRHRLTEGLPPLAKNFLRFRASDGSIHDIPAKYLNDALHIDPQLRLLDNARLQEHDKQIMRTFRYLLIAAQDL
jgi:hypothetical protein